MEHSSRVIYNPIQKDYVRFIQTVAETNGGHTLVEVELAPGGGVGLHYHKTYTETFECLEGELKVQLGKKICVVKPGDAAVTAERNILHRFFNTSEMPCRFTVAISPGSRGFEESLQIGYGLARDGKTNAKGLPLKTDDLGVLLLLSESKLPGWQGFIERILLWVGKRAEKKGVTGKLREEYVRI